MVERKDEQQEPGRDGQDGDDDRRQHNGVFLVMGWSGRPRGNLKECER